MSPNGKSDDTVRDPIAIMEALLNDVAEQAAEDYVPTKEDVRWARGLSATVERRLSNLERQPPRAPEARFVQGVRIPDALQRFDRARLLNRLEILRRNPHVQYAHRDLTRLSDDDLRRLIALLMQPAEK